MQQRPYKDGDQVSFRKYLGSKGKFFEQVLISYLLVSIEIGSFYTYLYGGNNQDHVEFVLIRKGKTCYSFYNFL